MKPAVRISRVRMKNGGADVRVLHRDPASPIIESARQFIRDMEAYTEPPSAFVAIALWASDDLRHPYIINWDTIDPTLPLPALMSTASAQIGDEAPILVAQHRIMKRLGYRSDDDVS